MPRIVAACLLWITALPATAHNSLPYTHLQLQGVPEQGALRANNGSFRVRALLQPELQAGHSLRLVLDDRPYGTPSRGPELPLVNIDRGQHRLALQVLDGERVVQQGPSVSFTLLRAHRP